MSSIVLKAQNRITDVAKSFLYGHFFGRSPPFHGPNVGHVWQCPYWIRNFQPTNLCQKNIIYNLKEKNVLTIRFHIIFTAGSFGVSLAIEWGRGRGIREFVGNTLAVF